MQYMCFPSDLVEGLLERSEQYPGEKVQGRDLSKTPGLGGLLTHGGLYLPAPTGCQCWRGGGSIQNLAALAIALGEELTSTNRAGVAEPH